VPIESSNLQSIIPEEDSILYSTLWKGNIIYGNKTYNWKSHILITTTGVAHMYPDIYTKGNPMQSDFTEWGQVDSIIKLGKLRMVINIKGFTYELFRLKEVESGEDFQNRRNEFLARFRPVLIKKKEEWLNKNKDTTDKRMKKYIRQSYKILESMKNKEAKRLSK
jgi:hypothetical protein